jgi:hypothetical protein
VHDEVDATYEPAAGLGGAVGDVDVAHREQLGRDSVRFITGSAAAG